MITRYLLITSESGKWSQNRAKRTGSCLMSRVNITLLCSDPSPLSLYYPELCAVLFVLPSIWGIYNSHIQSSSPPLSRLIYGIRFLIIWLYRRYISPGVFLVPGFSRVNIPIMV